MELAMTNGFCELNEGEIRWIDGGGAVGYVATAVSSYYGSIGGGAAGSVTNYITNELGW